jgi:nuclease HARBI1
MSLRYWNTSAERHHARQLVLYTQLLMAEDDESSSSSSLNTSNSSLSSMSISISISSSALSSLSLSSMSTNSSSSESTESSAALAMQRTAAFHRHIYAPIIDDTIDFDTPPKIIQDYNDSKCLSHFRFRKNELQLLANLLWPRLQNHLHGNRDGTLCTNGYRVPYETGLLILLYRLSHPNRIRPEMEAFFSMRKSKISAVLDTYVSAMYAVALPYLSNPAIFEHRWNILAEMVRQKSNNAVMGVWGFIDGTFRRTCRPSRFQRLAYSGHKRSHGIKFQSVVTPDGLIAMLYGPIAGSRHDSFLLGQSNLLQQLRDCIPVDPLTNRHRFQLYGDPAYPQSGVIFGGYRNARPGSHEAAWNTQMSRVREAVEWLFKEIITQWRFLDFRPTMKIFLSPIGKYYTIGAFLTNLRCCCYGSQTTIYFGTNNSNHRMDMESYLNLIAIE